MSEQDDSDKGFVTTGVPRLDEILLGGLLPNGVYLLEGESGAGKTAMGMQFLLEGVRRGEKTLHISLSENQTELQTLARSHNWSLDKIAIFEILHFGEQIGPEAQYSMFHPSEVELSEMIKKIFSEVERIGPRRVVIDSLADLRMMSQNPLWFRRQILALKRFFAVQGCTVLLMDDRREEFSTRTVVEGVLALEQVTPEYGGHRRRLRVPKRRGSDYIGGYHDFIICTGGAQVFPRLISHEHHQEFVRKEVRSGIPELDALAGGGLASGSSTLLLGPSGTGKSSLSPGRDPRQRAAARRPHRIFGGRYRHRHPRE